MPDLFLITGTSGSFSNEDHYDWPVAVYTSAESAAEHVRRAARWVGMVKRASRLWEELRLGAAREESAYFNEFGDLRRPNPYDPAMIWNHNGVRYGVQGIALNPLLPSGPIKEQPDLNRTMTLGVQSFWGALCDVAVVQQWTTPPALRHPDD